MNTAKGYKQTEIGLIPTDWNVQMLGEVVKVIGGGTPSTNNKSFWNGNINWFTPTEIGSSKYVSVSIRKISEAGYNNSSATLLPKGTILLTSRAGIGDAAILLNEATTNQGFQSLLAGEKIHNEFLYYLIISKKGDLLRLASGSTFLEISPAKVKSIVVPLPPLPEQTAIANALSDMDALIAQTEKLIEKKKAIKQGVMQELLKPKEGWVTKKLGEVCEIKKGQLITDSTRVNGDIPVIAGGKTPAYYHNQSNRLGKTITISGSGASAGYVSFHDYPIFASDCSTISSSNKYNVEFIFYWLQLNQSMIFSLQTGGAQPHIHPSDLNPLDISLPPIDNQDRIAIIFRELQSDINLLETKLQKLKHQKQGMMQALLTGKIRLI